MPIGRTMMRQGRRPASVSGGAIDVPVIALLALNELMAFDGDSITAGAFGPTYIDSAIMAMGGRLSYRGATAYNTAISGATAAALSDPAHTSETMATAPKLVTGLAGTNDLANTSATPAAIFGSIKTMWRAYLDAGAKAVVWSTVLPRGGSNALTTARETDRLALNTLIRNFASDPTLAGYASKIRVVDNEGAIVPGTDTLDGLHPNWRGSRKLGIAMGAAVASISPTTTLDGAHLLVGNLFPDKVFAGSGGFAGFNNNVTGTVPAQFYCTADTGLAVALSATADAAGYPAIKLTVTGTTTQASVVVFGGNSVAVNGVAGDRFEQSWYAKLANTQALRSFYLHSDNTATNSPNFSAPSQVMDGVPTIEGFLRTYVSPALTGNVASDFPVATLFFGVGTAAAELTLSQPRLRKVT